MIDKQLQLGDKLFLKQFPRGDPQKFLFAYNMDYHGKLLKIDISFFKSA